MIFAYVLIVLVAAFGQWQTARAVDSNHDEIDRLACVVTQPISLPKTGDPSRTINRNRQLAAERRALIGSHQC